MQTLYFDQVMRAALVDELIRLLFPQPLKAVAQTSTGTNTHFYDGHGVLPRSVVQRQIKGGLRPRYHLLRGFIPRSNPNDDDDDNLG